MTARLILVDDDDAIREMLHKYLENNGFRVTAVKSAEEAEPLLGDPSYQLILLDMMMPGLDGLTFCRRIRESGNPIAIIFLTAKRQKLDRIIGLEVGADDYVCKPFDPRELLARISAVLRRYQPTVRSTVSANTVGGRYCFGDCCLDLVERQLYRENRPLAIPNCEFELLKAFIQHQAQPLSRDELMALTRGRSAEPMDRTIDVLISRLRKIVEPDPMTPRYIQTVRGVGYRFVPD